MTKPLEFSIKAANEDEAKAIVQGVNAYNLKLVPAVAPTWTPLEFIAKDRDGTIIGGILGGIGYWNGLEIRLLWVAESYRNQGYGSQILKHMENVAKTKGAVISILDTFNFQAEGFYLKNGYEPIGEIKNFPKGHRRIYFSKRLE